jgi:Leucine-rich repeat (LRR) protein
MKVHSKLPPTTPPTNNSQSSATPFTDSNNEHPSNQTKLTNLPNDLIYNILTHIDNYTASSILISCQTLRHPMNEIIKSTLGITEHPTAGQIWVFLNFKELLNMGFSKDQIKSIAPDALKTALDDYNTDLPNSITDKLNPFLSGPGKSFNLNNENLTLGQLCKVIQLIKDSDKLSELEGLHLRVNPLTALPESIGTLPALKTLDVSFNQLTKLPESIGTLPALQQLKLSYNHLTALPESIGTLSALKGLGLSNNQLPALPQSIWTLPALQWLDISDNQLTALPESIGTLSALKTLDVSFNQLTELPDSFGTLPALQQLNLSFNQLPALPQSIGKLPARIMTLAIPVQPL